MRLSAILSGLALLAAAFAAPTPTTNSTDLVERAEAGDKLVFCHFMIGVVSNRQSSYDYDSDMQRARDIGIDAFALNIGTDDYTDIQLGYAYDSAARNGMKVFISFDFNWYHTDQASVVGAKIAQYAGRDGQLKIGNAVFASSFAGDGVDSQAIRNAAGMEVFWAPNFRADTNVGAVDGLLNWIAWPNNGANKAPSGGNSISVASGDAAYRNALGGKPLIAPLSPWFFTHFGPEVSYSKNWVFPSDMLIYRRWMDILATQPQFVEMITWNDYGESHYMGPLSSSHTDDGGSKWANDMPHTGWLELSKPFIAALKAGKTDVTEFITEDQLIYWYRTAPKALNCDSTDTTMQPADNSSGNYFEGRPDGWDTMTDEVFVVALLTQPGTAGVNTGGTVHYFDAPAGASAFSVPFNTGPQSFILLRNDTPVLRATSLKEIKNECSCGIYNFNAYVGTVPEGPSDVLDATGLSNFATGLHVQCPAQSTLGITPPAEAAITVTLAAGTPAPTSPAVRR
ncbi:glycoside hydrolase family 71 protein [Schizophyllum amplum]|uniref:Glycoside hydrolase family 71 protein n=1 Tax=Schizophyllum amplum TaxID=97359 RepID=A0A550BW00_9AGAR|nr:glycoside hydrolase family 71 protein [Auriculariopsis ampla]